MPPDEYVNDIFARPLPVIIYTTLPKQPKQPKQPDKLVPSQIQYKRLKDEQEFLHSALKHALSRIFYDDNFIPAHLLRPLLTTCASMEISQVPQCMYTMIAEKVPNSYITQLFFHGKRIGCQETQRAAAELLDIEYTPDLPVTSFNNISLSKIAQSSGTSQSQQSSTEDNQAAESPGILAFLVSLLPFTDPPSETIPFNSAYHAAFILFHSWLHGHVRINQPEETQCEMRESSTRSAALRWLVDLPEFHEEDGVMVATFSEFVIGKGKSPKINRFKPEPTLFAKFSWYGLVNIDMNNYAPCACQRATQGYKLVAAACNQMNCKFNYLGRRTMCQPPTVFDVSTDDVSIIQSNP